MFVTKNQLLVFIACVAFGGGVGGVYSIFSGIVFFVKQRLLKIILTALISFPIGLLYVFYSHELKFPDFRPYMLLGIFVGIYLYFKIGRYLL